MGEVAVYILLFCSLSLFAIFLFLSVFSISDPAGYIKWFLPLNWLSKKVLASKNGKCDHAIASVASTLNLMILLAIAFVIGGYFFTSLLHLWNSPFSLFGR